VIPKWAFNWHRESWRGKIKGVYLSIGVAIEEQDSNKHYLMCDKCEQLASKAEEYVRTLVSGSMSAKRRRKIIILPARWFLHIDVPVISRFVAIVALRCHYARSAPFHNLSMPRQFRKQLRQKIFGHSNSHTKPWLTAVKVIAPQGDPEHDPRCDITVHFEFNDILGPVFTALIGGWEWYLWFDPKADWLKGVSLYRSWFVRVELLPYNEHRNISRMAEMVAPYRGKLKSRLP